MINDIETAAREVAQQLNRQGLIEDHAVTIIATAMRELVAGYVKRADDLTETLHEVRQVVNAGVLMEIRLRDQLAAAQAQVGALADAMWGLLYGARVEADDNDRYFAAARAVLAAHAKPSKD